MKLNFNLSKALLLIMISCFTSVITIAQKPTREEKKLIKKARKDLANEKYADAQAKYTKLVSINPKSDVYNFETGLSYYFADFEREKSVSYLEAALKNSVEDTIPELKYYLGRAYQINGQFEESKSTFEEFTSFIKKQTKPGQHLLKETQLRIKDNENGIELAKKPNTNLKVINLGNGVNTLDREYAPVFRKEDNVILFTSRRANSKGKTAVDLLPYEDIYAAKKKEDGNWNLLSSNEELGKYLPNDFNTKKHDAGVIYSFDGNTLYTYKKDQLWKSTLTNSQWSKLEPLNDNINESQFNVPSITVTQDGNTMFFVTTKKDGFGGKDIYKSIKGGNGDWGSPENLGPEINTEFDEDAPFLSHDGKTLYFSSKGHKGIGGYDIYKSTLVDGKVSSPENMGLPLNSPLDDIYLVIDENEEIGFFSSDRVGGNGGMDIYGFNMSCPNIENTEIRGIVYNKTTHQPIQCKLTLSDISDNNSTNEVNSLPSNGKFLLTAPPEKSYKLAINAAGFEPQAVTVNIPKQCEFYPLFIEIALEKTTKDGAYVQLATVRNSFFNASKELTSAQENGNQIDTSNITKEIPFINTANDNDFKNDILLTAFTRTIDTSNTDLNYSIISDAIKIDSNIASNEDLISFYQEFFGYNIKEVNTNHPDYIKMLTGAIQKLNSQDKIYIDIESSASRVPTKTFKTNINLASLRGDEAKSIIVKSLTDKGISANKIVVNTINSIVSGPKYIGDYKNTEKYHKFQYVKITIK